MQDTCTAIPSLVSSRSCDTIAITLDAIAIIIDPKIGYSYHSTHAHKTTSFSYEEYEIFSRLYYGSLCASSASRAS